MKKYGRKKKELLAGLSKGDKGKSNYNKGGLKPKKRSGSRLNSSAPTLEGRVEVGRNGDFAFLFIEGVAAAEKPFIARNDLNGAMHGDRVQAVMVSFNKGAGEAAVTKILERSVKNIVGVYVYNKMGGFVQPDDSRFGKEIFIDTKQLQQSIKNDLQNLDKVVVELDYTDNDDFKEKTGRNRRNLKGRIVEILGAFDDVGMDILSIIRAHNLYESFSQTVLDEANRVAIEPPREEVSRRSDFRGDLVFTIDGDDSKDFDDAVALEVLANGNYKLSVHIADVTHYVKPKTALDKEAFKRGTSVYFVDRVLPMLPEVLSNGMCSLNEGVDRLVLSCIMQIDISGGIVDYQIVEGVINSVARTTYSMVSKALETNEELGIRNEELLSNVAAEDIKRKKNVNQNELNKNNNSELEKYIKLLPTLKQMETLAGILNHKRKARGNIDFDIPESNIILDKNGRTVDIVKKPRLLAHRIIEEFMLAANETVAKFLGRIKAPGVFRVHETPPSDKLDSFKDFLKALAVEFNFKSDTAKPKEFQELLELVKGSNRELAVTKTALRTMAKANYEPEDKGHFGLAAENYCHFTSPIRRYPDLAVHRVIKEFLAKGSEGLAARFLEFCTKAASNSSERERLAEKAEREVDDLKKAEFMLDKIGQEFAGVISGVNERGIFVELENTVEGLVKIENLPGEAYEFIERQLCIKNKSLRFTIGDTVRIVVAAVNGGKVEFELNQ